MNEFSPLLIAVYGVLLVFSATATYLYGRHVLWPAVRSKSFRLREHGLVVALVCAFGADSVEALYWGVSRTSDELYTQMSYAAPAVGGLKVLILLGSLFAIGQYVSLIRKREVMSDLIGLAFGLWLLFAVLLSAILGRGVS